MAWISVVPLIVVLILLFRQRNMVVAAAAGGLLAIVIAYLFREHLPLVQESVNGETRVVILDLKRAFYRFSSTIPSMLSFTSPIVNASAAAMVAAFGGFAALLEIARRRLNGRMELLAAFVVMLQAFATYTAGLGAGNTVIFKPSSTTSLSVLELARLIDEAGLLPKGVLNVVTGSGSKSGEYLQHADVDKLAFTGSTEVGRGVAHQTMWQGY